VWLLPISAERLTHARTCTYDSM